MALIPDNVGSERSALFLAVQPHRQAVLRRKFIEKQSSVDLL
jgi:hypothetical protein